MHVCKTPSSTRFQWGLGSATDSRRPSALSEAMNFITSHPPSTRPGQFNTFSLLTVQMQIQYRCGHKVQDWETPPSPGKPQQQGWKRTNMQA